MIDDGGPAFPTQEWHQGDGNPYPLAMYWGASLRDEFAKAALQGLLASPDTRMGDENAYANACYRMADAMIRRRTR